MLKLYRRDAEGLSYWEAWETDEGVQVHWGAVGDIGQTRDVPPAKGEDAEAIVAREAAQPRSEGFKEIPLEDHATLVVQYAATGTKDDGRRLPFIEQILNEHLGWTGNGQVESADAEGKKLNVFCLVVDAEIAARSIVDELIDNDVEKGALVAVMRPEDDEPRVVWPKDFKGEFSY